jgi:hypothetical protein
MSEMKATTLPDFNPSGKPEVAQTKNHIEDCIERIKGMNAMDARCRALALTKLEEASMWAVKGLFV